MAIITSVTVEDVRFPTSVTKDGSDAMNKDADYSAAYVTITTDAVLGDRAPLSGYGLTFTIGRGNDLVVAAARQQAVDLVGRDIDAMATDMGALYRDLTSDSQLRWLGPEKGVVHLSLAAVLNACWDLVSRRATVPLWRFLADMSPEQLADAADLRYVSDALTRDEAVVLLQRNRQGLEGRVEELRDRGYPAYTTSPGWLGYSDAKLRSLCAQAVTDGYRAVKLKVGANLEDDIRRCGIAREVLGDGIKLMIDANQVWDVDEAITWVTALARFDPLWIEEPTSPDDILGHAVIRKAVSPVGVATGEHAHNRVMFKQFMQAEAIDYCQLDTGRLASINEILTVQLLAAKFGIPVCPHAGGVGLVRDGSARLGARLRGRLGGARGTNDRVRRPPPRALHRPLHRRGPRRWRGYVLPTKPGYSTEPPAAVRCHLPISRRGILGGHHLREGHVMSRTDDVVDAIKQMLIRGDLKAGDRLPIEKDLAERLNVSRGSLREGVRALSVLGIVETRQGDGSYITGLEPSTLIAPIGFIVELGGNGGSDHLHAVRRILEVESARLAATRMTPESLSRAERILTEAASLLGEHEPEHERLIELDIAFHHTIAEQCGNPVLAAMLEALGEQDRATAVVARPARRRRPRPHPRRARCRPLGAAPRRPRGRTHPHGRSLAGVEESVQSSSQAWQRRHLT